ncbi:hypothetical protein ACFYVR_21405 [Rhodococcus sp. NPDC003318]|uniref:hypothetical protein n=1 Tax=Rhodococcus sp. NPDC003318 TaxID=3364503 RepID=UPI00367E9F91
MSAKITHVLAVTALVVTLGALAPPAAFAGPPNATPALGSVSVCFSVPLGSAALVWCI